jgi:hypothetical protein
MAKSAKRRRSWKKIVLWTIVGLVVLFGAIQLVPYGRGHDNPPANNPFKWTDANAQAIAKKSCYDCHSNDTDWWWATNIAPFSWLVQKDVDGGRSRLDFSDWQGSPDAAGLREAITEGMPPFQYTLIHPSAKLSDAQKKTLAAGYAASISANQASTLSSSPSSSPSSTDATAVINARCGGCHSAQSALDFRASSVDQAAQLIDDMVGRGASVTAAEKQTMIKYFTQ